MLNNRRTGERRYSSTACLACRKRKIKCDNDRPRCSNCQLYDIDCVLGEDRRRTSSTVKTISVLTSRLDGLEGRLARQQTAEARQNTSPPAAELLTPSNDQNRSLFAADDSPSFSSSSSGELRSVGNTRQYGGPDMDYWVQIAECPDFIDSVATEAQINGVATGHNTRAPTTEGELDGQMVTLSDEAQHTSEPPFRQSALYNASSNLTLQISEVPMDTTEYQDSSVSRDFGGDILRSEPTLQLASRLGQLQLAENGQVRYYGATSNLHLISNGLLSLFEPSIRTVRAEGATALHRAGLAAGGDADYEQHLTNLYFTWHNSLLNEVNKDIYLSEKKTYESGQDTLYYSPTLANAIMAVGAAYSTSHHPEIDEDAAEYFALRAKTLLEIEIDCPTLATAQALLVLSAHEAARTRDSRGWIFVGMAVQVVTDLGLHLGLDPDHTDTNSTPVPVGIAELRKNVFWATYTACTLWSSYNGRPSLMSLIQYNVSGPNLPSHYRWEYYEDRMDQRGLPSELDLGVANIVPMHITRLATILVKISNLLYTGIPGPISDANMSHMSVAEELRQWRDSLPASLRVDANRDWSSRGNRSYLPMVLQLHMQYHEAIILLHRPFIAEARELSALSSEGLDAAQYCTQSASEISRLLLIYRRQWGLQHINLQAVHIVMTAGIVHAHNSCLYSGPRGRSARDLLHTCLQALGEMGQTFQSGNRGLQVVMALLHDWQSQSLSLKKRQQGFHSALQNDVGS